MKRQKLLLCIMAALASMILCCTAVGFAAGTTTDPTANLSTKIENGGFEVPHINGGNSSDGGDLNVPGSDGNDTSGPWYLRTAAEFETMANTKQQGRFWWKTTAYNGLIELVTDVNNKMQEHYHTTTQKIEGDQFAELVGEEESALYQNIRTIPGAVLTWGLKHKARKTDNNTKADTMALVIGQIRSDDVLNKTSTNDKKIFQLLGLYIKGKVLNNTYPQEEAMSEHIIYSQDNISNISESNIDSAFSLAYDAEHPRKWSCWIISSTASNWHQVKGTYNVPEGQTTTAFAFTALNSVLSVDHKLIEGNLLDDITFRAAYPLKVATTGGGTGTVNAETEDAFDGTPTDNVSVTYAKDFDKRYYDGSTVTIKATPQSSDYKFLGAYVEGKFRKASDSIFKYDKTDGSYTLDVEMNAPRYVHLMFSRPSYVIYDPNGGTYNGTNANTCVKILPYYSSTPPKSTYDSLAKTDTYEFYKWTNTSTAHSEGVDPTYPDGWRFIGWYFGQYTNKTTNETGVLITSNHTVQRDPDDPYNELKIDFTNSAYGENGNASNSYTVTASDGIVLVAQYRYRQRAIAMTKDISDTKYTESITGGTVKEMTIKKDPSANSRELETKDIPDTQKCGYGSLKDRVTLKAEPNNPDYIFMGWYDKDGNLLSNERTYSYIVSEPRDVYAYFSAVVSYPYLSFVKEEEDTAAANTEATADNAEENIFSKSHVKVQDTVINGYGGAGGQFYGNTISTGFSTTQRKESGEAYNYCQWRITIPVDEKTYVKLTDKLHNTSNVFKVDTDPVLTDTNAIYNKGKIYKVNGLINNQSRAEIEANEIWSNYIDALPDRAEENATENLGDEAVPGSETELGDTSAADSDNGMQFNDDNQEVVVLEDEPEFNIYDYIDEYGSLTGYTADPDTNTLTFNIIDKIPTFSGSGTVVFGIVLDNIYAPSAWATIHLGSTKEKLPPSTEGEKDISSDPDEDNPKWIRVPSSDDYTKHRNDLYN